MLVVESILVVLRLLVVELRVWNQLGVELTLLALHPLAVELTAQHLVLHL
jgi:hypothetical protein